MTETIVLLIIAIVIAMAGNEERQRLVHKRRLEKKYRDYKQSRTK